MVIIVIIIIAVIVVNLNDFVVSVTSPRQSSTGGDPLGDLSSVKQYMFGVIQGQGHTMVTKDVI